MKKAVFFLLSAAMLAVTFNSCNSKPTEEVTEEKQKTERDTDFSGELPELSVYHLPSNWTNQNGEEIQLADFRGDIIVSVMIYTTCKAACPRLIADVRRVHSKVSESTNKQVKYVFVSIDPEVDTPETMKKFAKDNDMDSDQWVFLRGDIEDTREFASVLGVGYKRISPIDFSHSNIISVFDQNGELAFQKEGLGVDDESIVEAIEKLAL